jgi:hypothetical protein
MIGRSVMKKNILISVAILFLAASTVAGGVIAWFLSETNSPNTVLMLGTLAISEPVIVNQTIAEGQVAGTWYSGVANTVDYSIKNIGTMQSYIRVKPKVEFESALIIEDDSPVYVEIIPASTNLISGSDGWYYYKSKDLITVEEGQTIHISFNFNIPNGAEGNIIIDLLADSIQVDSASITKFWGQVP